MQPFMIFLNQIFRIWIYLAQWFSSCGFAGLWKRRKGVQILTWGTTSPLGSKRGNWNPLHMAVLMGKSSVNGEFSIGIRYVIHTKIFSSCSLRIYNDNIHNYVLAICFWVKSMGIKKLHHLSPLVTPVLRERWLIVAFFLATPK